MSVISSDSRRALKTLAVVGGKQQVQHSARRLTRSLGSLETWSFGLTGHVGWIGTAPVIHAALGSGAIFVWLPGVIVSVLLNLQVQRLGRCWPDMAGGTPNYAARLLNNYPGLGRYVALGYFIGWSAAPVVYAIVLTDLIKANLEPLGIACPETILKIGFTAIAFIVGFSGTRALGLLHLFFVVPAVAFLLAFCLQGLGWLAFSPAREGGLFPTHLSSPSFGEWAKWFFIATYSVYSCETASSFVADSLRPKETLRFLSFAASLIPPVFIGGSWVLMQLATQPGLGDNLYLNLKAAAQPFWGQSASFFVTLLIAFCSLLSCATTVANTSRVLYQLALDGHLSPVFTVVSRRGVLGPALIFTFVLSLLCLAWGNLSHVLMVTGTGYLVSIMGLHLGLWLRRGYSEVRWPWLSLGFFIVEAVVLVVGGLSWSWQDLLLGLLFPLAILAVDAAMRRIAFAPFHPKWWLQRYYARRADSKTQDFVMLQVIVLIILICSAVTIGWVIKAEINTTSGERSADLLGILLITLSFVGVAIACWTTLPQIAAIDEARQQAENLFITALDAILVLDEKGAIVQTNPAAEELFQIKSQSLLGQHLNKLLPALVDTPDQWPNRCEQTLLQSDQSLRILESTISQQSTGNLQEYTVILRDITYRVQAEETLQLFAGIASSRARGVEELKPVFNKAITTAREILKADRVVIYRFYPDWSGYIAAESVVTGWPKALADKIDDPCIPEHLIEAYRKGRVVATNNVFETNYSPEHIRLLEQLEVKASLVTPILQNDELFGLLVAHHCDSPHAWQQSQINFLTQLAAQVGIALDRVNFLEQQKTAKEQLQKRALELLMQVDPVSKGDLTIRASVTEDEIGTVADSYNATVASLRKIVTKVQAAALQVAATTSSSEVSVLELSKEALRQTEEIAAALDRIQEMSNSIRAVAANAKLAETAVQQATQTVEAGDAAMNRTVDGILAIRETVAQTSKKVKRLGESSQKISKVVNLIGTFAEKTNLLALNASIEAAHAGEQGRGFAVVADQVRALARQSAQATAEIESLVKDIQTETNSVVAAMEAGTLQVVEGTKLVDETRTSLNKITAVSAQISSLVEAITSDAVAQSQVSESVTQTMSDVAAIAQHTSNEATQVSASFKELLAVAQDLQASAGQFKVS